MSKVLICILKLCVAEWYTNDIVSEAYRVGINNFEGGMTYFGCGDPCVLLGQYRPKHALTDCKCTNIAEAEHFKSSLQLEVLVSVV